MRINAGIHDLNRQNQEGGSVNKAAELIIGFLVMLFTGCLCTFILGMMLFFTFGKRISDDMDAKRSQYEIIDYFACSDYCPGDPEQYMVKIYDGVHSEKECKDIGGDPKYVKGWGSEFICIVK